MKKLGIILLFLALSTGFILADDNNKPAYQIADNTFFDPTRKEQTKEAYDFRVDYRLEVGYVQHWQRTRRISYPDMYLHGIRLGATFSFALPMRFDLQTGLLYTLVYGRNDQHWRSIDAPSVQTEYIRHRVLEHNLTIPVRVYYNIPLWKQLNMFFFTGPQLGIGLTEHDFVKPHLSAKAESWLQANGYETEEYDRLSKEVSRVNIQWGVGGGLEWDKYRLQAGYQFGLNNMVRKKVVSDQHMWQWGWFVTFCYRF